MADVELNFNIINKLHNTFNVPEEEITELLKFFNNRLKPAIKVHYLSHLVSSIEEMINEQEKKEFLDYIKETERTEKDIATLTNLINERRLRLFTINLQALPGVKRKAKTYKKAGGVMIYYAGSLLENEKRFAIAHELGHIVSEYLLKNQQSNNENYASLFAYVALLDKNNFYKNECSAYISKTDVELFNEYMNVLHIYPKK
ncbi:ImmA/IrrE family metallo-endopeptidase [Treponema pedis]|uniref:ImmA/IrrE family metallo-endopeptidase n=1 Tax=Treponema pedis TaxID=409322 RepID=UPI003142AEBE